MQQCADCHGANPHPADSPVQSILIVPRLPGLSDLPHPDVLPDAEDEGRVVLVRCRRRHADARSSTTTTAPTTTRRRARSSGRRTYGRRWLWHDGKWDRLIVNDADTYATTPVVLAKPSAAPQGPGAKIYPFKKMIGNQVADTVNSRVMVPHLFGTAGGPNPYWVVYDWDLALEDGSAYTGQPYSGHLRLRRHGDVPLPEPRGRSEGDGARKRRMLRGLPRGVLVDRLAGSGKGVRSLPESAELQLSSRPPRTRAGLCGRT